MIGRGIFENRTMLWTHLSPHRDRRLHGKLFLMDRFFWRQQNVSLARAKVQPEKQATSHQKRNSQYIVKHRKPIQPATMQNPFLSWRGYGSQSHWQDDDQRTQPVMIGTLPYRLTRVQFSPPQNAPTQPSTRSVAGPVTATLLA